MGWIWGGGCPPPRLTPFLAQAKGRQKRVKAVADCKGDKARELTFSKGEVIVVTREEDEQSWVSPPGAQPSPSPPHFPVILSGLLIFGGSRMGTPRPVCAGGGHRRLPVTSHKCLWPSVLAFLSLATHRGTPPHPPTPLSAPPGRLHRGRRLPHRCLPCQLRPPLARLTGSPPLLPILSPSPGGRGRTGWAGSWSRTPPGPSVPSPLSTGHRVLLPDPSPCYGTMWLLPSQGTWGPPGCGTLPPWTVALESRRAATAPAAISCTLRGGFGACSALAALRPFVGSAHPGGFLLACQRGFGAGGGRSGCPPLSSAGWAQSPCPRSPGGSCNAPPGFLLYHNCEALGIGREQKRAFYSLFLGVWRVCGHILPPPPGL